MVNTLVPSQSKRNSEIFQCSYGDKIQMLVCLALDKWFTIAFSHFFAFALREWKAKLTHYPAMDSLVHGESDGISFISAEDCIRKL